MERHRLLAAALAFAAWGCGPGDGPLRQGPVFDAPVAESIEVRAVLERSERFLWPFGAGSDAWTPAAETPLPESAAGVLTIPPREAAFQLTRQTDLAAVDFQSVAVTLEKPSDPPWIRMCFTLSEGGGRRCQSVHPAGPQRSGAAPFRFWPARMPGWEGRIGEVRLIVGPSQHPLRLAHLSGEAWRPRPDALERPWRVELVGAHYLDERVALLAPIGQAIRRRVAVPRSGGVWEVSVGAWPMRPGPLEVRVSARTWRGAQLQDAHLLPASELSERTGQPRGDRVAWQDLEIDLSRWAGSTVELVFEADSPEDRASAATLVAWSGMRLRTPPKTARPNIVLVSIDTLRADHLSLYGYQRPTSPALDALARRCGVVFEQVVAPAPWTLPSHVSIFTGLDPISHRVNYATRAPEALVTLAERLRDAGYRSTAVTGGAYTSSQYGLSQGFDRYLQVRRAHEPGELANGVDVAIREIERLGGTEPFLLFLHTYDVHSPYRAREPYASRFSGTTLAPDRVMMLKRLPRLESSPLHGQQWPYWVEENRWWREGQKLEEKHELGRVVDLYDAGIAHTDGELGRLFQALEASDAGRRSVLVVTSDHGEALGERGAYGHGIPHENNLHVPLVLSLPGCHHAGTRVASRVRLIDIAPTLLELASLDATDRLDGRSLLPLLDGSERERREAWAWAASNNRGVVLYTGDGLKYVLQASAWHPLHGQEALYDLTRDPDERRNLAAASPETARLRDRVLGRLRASLREPLLMLANSGSETLRARIDNAPAASSVKSARPSTARVEWRGSRSFDLELPPGGRLELMLLRGLRAPLSLHVGGDAEALQVPAAGEAVWAARRSADGWETLPACPPEGTRVCLLPGAEAGVAPEGPELEQQLRALGYLE